MKPSELRSFLKRHDMTTRQLANILGVSHQAVDHWTCGRRDISEMLSRLILMFDNDPEDMDYFESFASGVVEQEH
jgi:DNA-binding transcriptional regulator YiaG